MQAIPPIHPPVIGNEVNINDVHNVISYRKLLNKRQKVSPENVTIEELVNAVITEKQTIERYAGEQVAPPWFAEAMAIQLHHLTALNLQVTRLTNRKVKHPMDAITPVLGVVIDNFPITFEELRNLTNQRCNHIINAYNIQGNFHNALEKRMAIAAYIGVKFNNENVN